VTLPVSLATSHGPLALPAYFPDGTRGVVRTLDGQDLERCGVAGLVVNTFHLSTRPGAALIKQAGGIHRFMGWSRPIASDSGGFQLMSMVRENPKYGTVSERGIHFADIDGSRQKEIFSPERSIRLQFDLGTDLMICLDDCPRADASPEEVRAAVERTIRWAGRCRAEFDRQVAARRCAGRPQPLLFGVIQGGYDPAMRRQCAEGLLPLSLDGFGFGGWPLTPEGDLAAEILEYTAALTPPEMPRFALGVGKPEHIVRCAQWGWRIFDCVLPTRDARHGRLYAYQASSAEAIDLRAPGFYHFVYIRDEKHRRQHNPISAACDCPCCRHYTLAYLHHLFAIGDPLAMRLATMHNLRFYTQLLERI